MPVSRKIRNTDVKCVRRNFDFRIDFAGRKNLELEIKYKLQIVM